ncbi:MAG: prepilin-type N-terminal cleavage/methylation domain-containing protein [Planctomycetota bacterium]
MTHTTPLRRRARACGFTIVELLVAVSVLSLMLFLINTLFFQTTEAVSTGVRTSTVLANARATNDRIALDASAMLGPNASNPVPQGGGYIIIINKEVNAPVKRQDGTTVIETFRVDQLVYVASASEANSRVTEFRGSAPRDATQFGSDFTSPYALVRYSHGRRTERDGSDNATFDDLGQPFVAGDPELSGRAAGLDRLANDWILARQAVLFSPTDSGNFPLQGTDWYVNWPFALEPVQNAGGLMAAGYCDVTLAPPADADPAVGFVNRFLQTGNAANPSVDAGTRTNNYLALTHINERLRVNPIPEAAGTDFEPGVVGQVHGVFAPNCSDFIVQFAADVDGDGQIDRSDNGTPQIEDDFIIWYDMDNLAFLLGLNANWDGATSSEFNAPYFQLATPHGDHAFIFRYNDDGTLDANETTAGTAIDSKWPYMIRIRYRLHDAPGRLESNASNRLFDNKDQNLDGTPDDADEAKISGRYFEQIIRVPRP